jgi:hypothetical protein
LVVAPEEDLVCLDEDRIQGLVYPLSVASRVLRSLVEWAVRERLRQEETKLRDI